MIPSFPDFKPLEAGDRNELLRALAAKNPQESELSAGNLFIWSEFDRPQLTRINDNLCLLLSPLNEGPFFLEPLGENRIEETTDICLRHTGRLARVSEGFAARIADGAYRLCTIRGQFDYLYGREALAEFKGKKYDGKRNHIKRFKAAFPDWKYLGLEPGMKDECLALFEVWTRKKKDTLYFQRLDEAVQREAIIRAFEGFGELGMSGGAVRAGGRLIGFIIGSPLNRDTVTVHFQYGDPDAQGVMQTLMQEAAAQTFSGFAFMNLEQDLGLLGLRTAKLSYHPLRLVKKYHVEPA
jgi:hypothetical protein